MEAQSQLWSLLMIKAPEPLGAAVRVIMIDSFARNQMPLYLAHFPMLGNLWGHCFLNSLGPKLQRRRLLIFLCTQSGQQVISTKPLRRWNKCVIQLLKKREFLCFVCFLAHLYVKTMYRNIYVYWVKYILHTYIHIFHQYDQYICITTKISLLILKTSPKGTPYIKQNREL